MKINEIELVNWRQHKQLKINPTGNLIGIIGQNGSGKSNLLKGIQYGLVGEVPGLTKDRLTTWGETDGYVRLIIDDDIKIKRHTVENTVSFDSSKKHARTTTGVNAAVKEVFGLDKDLARSIFVHQAEIDSILFETPAKREQSFQRFCGMGTASNIHRQLGEIIFTKFKEPPNYDEQIESVNKNLVENSVRIVLLRAEQEQNKPALTAQEITQLKIQLTEYTGILHKVDKAITLKNEIDEFTKTIVADDSAFEDLRDKLRHWDIDKLDGEIDGAKAVLEDVKTYQAAKALYEQRQKEKDSLVMPVVSDVELHNLQVQYNSLNKRYIEAQAHITMYNGLLNVIFKTEYCPICDNVISNPLVVRTKLEKQLTEYKAVTCPTDLADRIVVIERNLDKAKSDADRADNSVINAKTRLDALEPLDVDVTKLTIEIVNMEKNRREVQNAILAMKQVEAKLTVNESLYVKKEEEWQSIQGTLLTGLAAFALTAEQLKDLKGVYDIVTNKCNELTDTIDKIIKQTTENSNREGIIGELQRSIDELQKTLKDLETKKAGLVNYAQVIKTLTSVRDWFAWNNGPRSLSVGILSDMAGDINGFLTRFDAPFSIVPNIQEGLSFNVIFHDGRSTGGKDVSADELSGGEKILLATSFRLASYAMFANKLGLLSLDEPTNYLDERNIVKFNSFLEKVKEVASCLNIQIFMATHERSTIPYFDTVIDLN